MRRIAFATLLSLVTAAAAFLFEPLFGEQGLISAAEVILRALPRDAATPGNSIVMH